MKKHLILSHETSLVTFLTLTVCCLETLALPFQISLTCIFHIPTQTTQRRKRKTLPSISSVKRSMLFQASIQKIVFYRFSDSEACYFNSLHL